MKITFNNLIHNLIPKILLNYRFTEFKIVEDCCREQHFSTGKFQDFEFQTYETENIYQYDYSTNRWRRRSTSSIIINYFRVINLSSGKKVFFEIESEFANIFVYTIEECLKKNIRASCEPCKMSWKLQNPFWICTTDPENFGLHKYPFEEQNPIYNGDNERRIGTIQENSELEHSCPICGDWTLKFSFTK